MIRFFNTRRARAERGAYWMGGQFDRRPNPFIDPAMATWSEILGRDQAKLWLAAKSYVERR